MDSSFPWSSSASDSKNAAQSIRQQHLSSDGDFRKRAPPLRIARVSQLDAGLLDSELENMFKDPVWKALDLIKGPLKRAFEPELLALLRLSILGLSIQESGASYGARLQNLKYRNEKAHRKDAVIVPSSDSPPTHLQLTLHILLSVFLPYLTTRTQEFLITHNWGDYPLPDSWTRFMKDWIWLPDFGSRWRAGKRAKTGTKGVSRPRPSREDDGLFADEDDSESLAHQEEEAVALLTEQERKRDTERTGRERKLRRYRELRRVIWEMVRRTEELVAIAGLINLCMFLVDGRFKSILDRILGLRLVYAKKSVARNVSYDFLNRQVLWETITDMLLFLMPLVNLRRLRHRMSYFLSRFSRLLLFPLKWTFSHVFPAAEELPPSSRGRKVSTDKIAPQNGDSSNSVKKPPLDGPLGFLPPLTCPICFSRNTAPPSSLPATGSLGGDPTDPLDPAASLSTLSHSGFGGAVGSIGGVNDLRNRVKIAYETECCGGLYCYYCLIGRVLEWEEGEGRYRNNHDDKEEKKADGDKVRRLPGWSCLRCGNGVGDVKRWLGGVDGTAITQGVKGKDKT